MRRAFLFVLVIAGVVTCVMAANLTREPKGVAVDWRIAAEPAKAVVAEPPARGPIVQTITAPGTVEAVEEAEIASQIVGRVVAVNVEDGDEVKKGQLLVKLDETDARARLDSAIARIERLRAAIDQADADVEKARRDFERFGRLNGRGASTATELADARSALTKFGAALAMSKHELVESEAMRRTNQQELDRTEIRAPMDGVVAGLDVEVGEVVIAGTTNLPGTVMMTISDLSRMRVRAEVDESDVPLVRAGQPSRVFLQADPETPIAGKVERVSPKGKKGGSKKSSSATAGSEDVISFETLVAIDGSSGALRPGMSATVEIEVRRAADALGVPVQAVVHRRRKDLPDASAVRAWAERHARSLGQDAREREAQYVKIVFILEGSVVRARPVETGLSDERRVEIRAGIGPDDRVVVGPFRALDELKDGSPVVAERAGAS